MLRNRLTVRRDCCDYLARLRVVIVSGGFLFKVMCSTYEYHTTVYYRYKTKQKMKEGLEFSPRIAY